MTKRVFTASTFGLAPERTARRNATESAVMDVFEQYGYMEVSLPIYEYYDVLKTITHNFRDEDIITFTDRASGRPMVLRPDFTPQVCRMVAGYKGDFPLPVRVYYRGTVFRNVNIDKGAKAEKYQIGCEMYGTKEITGDLELILCVNRVMQSTGVDNFRVVFGDAAYMSRILELTAEKSTEYKNILAEKAVYKMDGFLKDLNSANTALNTLLKALPTAFGGLKEIEELIKLSSFDERLVSRAEYLKEFFNEAVKHGVDGERIVFDPAETRGLDYYTGINFEILNTVTGESFGGGGRYDTLMRKFNVDYTACGMALDLTEIENGASSAADVENIDWIVIGTENLTKAEELRAQGCKVIHLFDRESAAKFIAAVKCKNIYGE